MARTITFSGNTLRQYIFGIDDHEDREEYDKYKSEYYYQGSANRRAQRSMTQGTPNYEPVPFKIPSEGYTDSYLKPHRVKPAEMNEEEWQESISPPNYIIDGYTSLGGAFDFTKATINWQEFSAGIEISNCTFTEGINIQYFHSESYIRFNKCTFISNVDLRNVQAKQISFFNCNFNQMVFTVSNCNIEELSVTNSENIIIKVESDKKPDYALQPFIIANDIPHKLNLITFSKINNADKITFAGQGLGKIILRKVDCKETEFDVKIDGIQIINDNVDNSKPSIFHIKRFKASVDEQVKSFISLLENLHIHEFILSGTLKDATLLGVALVIDKLLIQDFINEGKFRLNDVYLKSDGEAKLIRSQLGKAEFNYVNFSPASQFQIYLSNITEIIITNTIFPGNIIGKGNDDLEGSREIYRQLKNAAGKQGDRVNELRYEALEMHNFEKLLSTNKSSPDRWILKLNRWSNGHGQNWIRAGVILIAGAIVLFCSIKMFLGYWLFDANLIFSTLAEFLNFSFNPLHKFTDIFNKSSNPFLTGLAQFLDVLARLFTGFMIFQFLRAFRKYVR